MWFLLGCSQTQMWFSALKLLSFRIRLYSILCIPYAIRPQCQLNSISISIPIQFPMCHRFNFAIIFSLNYCWLGVFWFQIVSISMRLIIISTVFFPLNYGFFTHINALKLFNFDFCYFNFISFLLFVLIISLNFWIVFCLLRSNFINLI